MHHLKRLKSVITALIVITALTTVIHLAHAEEKAAPAADKQAAAINKDAAHGQATTQQQAPARKSDIIYIAAAICVGCSSLAGGWAVSTVGAAAMGAISEKPELAGRALIFVGLAEGIAIYGVLIAMVMLL